MNFRSIRVVASIASFLLLTTPKRKELRKVAETDPKAAARVSHEYTKEIMNRVLKHAGTTVDVRGLENIPDETVLFAGNHSSLFDLVVTESVIPVDKGPGYVAKDSLAKIPGLKGWMELVRCLFLDRSNMKEGLKTIFKGADYLKEGSNMFIFPEGTRSKTGELLEFKGASLKMAQKAKVGVVPVAITGTADIFENNPALSIKPSHVTITFAEPIYIHTLPRPEQKEAVNMVRQTIADIIEEVKAEEK